MIERPILFSTSMVKAILDGRKTQTRRLFKYAEHPAVTLITFMNKSHFAVQCWCGMTMCMGGSGKGTGILLETPSSNRPMCATCEGRAIGAGLLGVREIAGREVMYRAGGAA